MAQTEALPQAPLAVLERKWQQDMLKLLAQSDQGLAERIATQAIPRRAEIESQRAAMSMQRTSLEMKIRELQEQMPTVQDEEQQRVMLFSLSEHRRQLSIVNTTLVELDALEPGALRREVLEQRRSETCRCLGAGGIGRIIAVIKGVPLMQRACDECDEGRAYRTVMDEINARLDAEEEAEKDKARKEVHQARRTARLERSGIPSLYHTSDLRTISRLPVSMTPDFRDVLVTVHTSFKEPWKTGKAPRGFFLYGPAGHGKTSILAAIARICAEWDFPVMFTTVLNLLDSMRAGYGRKDNSSDDLLNRAKTISAGFFDDLGMQQGTDHERARILSIVTERHGQGSNVLTCFSSNYDMHRTAQMIAGGATAAPEEVARIEGRLREMADEVYIENLDLRVPANRRDTKAE